MADHNDPYGVGSFRPYDKFKQHWESDEAIHDIVFIEPKYTDDPIHTLRQPNDDHCPTGITGGQWFLADIYNTIISNPDKWESTMLIITYDEHGGFFDHVTPPKVPTTAGGVTFQTTGVRVPAFVVSPYVKPGSVFSARVDSTSILQLLADKFAQEDGYSPEVTARQEYFERLAPILENVPNRNEPMPIAEEVLKPLFKGAPVALVQKGSPSATSQAFQRSWSEMAKMHAW